jgi:5S rRNA maturation endonuclease (ribonuclease M5)
MGFQLMNKQMTKTFRSYNQHQLKVICDSLCDNIENLLDTLGIDSIKNNGKMLVGECPIHNGDNKSAFNLYPDGDSYRGNWKCRTHNCDKIFKGSIIGFIRGVLSNKKYNWQKNGDTTASFKETIDFIEEFLGNKLHNIKISKTEIEKKKFANIVKNIVSTDTVLVKSQITRPIARNALVIPCEYFISRGFSKNILDKYDVGLCDKPEKEMYNRAVAPIYDQNHKYVVGCTGRSIFEKCSSCNCYHNPDNICPNKEETWKYPKWKHNADFKSQNYLYNFWYAKDFIMEQSSVILVESPGNVWRLEECGIHNSVALFGSNLSDRQKIILDGSGAMNIIIITDNDEAGEKARQIIYDKCKNTYNITNIRISKNDIAELSCDQINEEIKSKI